MTDTKFISSDEFLARAENSDPNDRPYSGDKKSLSRFVNKNGGALFIGPMETKNDVNKFFDAMKRYGVIVECEDNKVQGNYAPTIRLTFTKPKNMLAAMGWVISKKPDEMHYIDDKTCCFWWD